MAAGAGEGLDEEKWTFVVPGPRIRSEDDVLLFHKSQAYALVLGFLHDLNDSVKQKKVSDEVVVSPMVTSLVNLLDSLIVMVDEIPPVTQPSRFGNKAFRDWHARLVKESVSRVHSLLPEGLKGAARELAPYLCKSFGDEQRIDYGTGHEATFMAFLTCFWRLRLLVAVDYPAVVFKVFTKYMAVIRKLLTVYVLEPAGSHGVWGLDDYQFVPYIFGSAQLIEHPYILPSSIHDREVVSLYCDDFLYLHMIRNINELKKGPFGEHSPMLNDISQVKTWTKLNGGMFKMYHGEVLAKKPVVQHFLFGAILPFEPLADVLAPPPVAASPAAPAPAPPASGADDGSVGGGARADAVVGQAQGGEPQTEEAADLDAALLV